VNFRQDELDHVVLFLRLVVHLPVFLRADGVAEGGIEDLFLDRGVDLELLVDLRDQLLRFRTAAHCRLLQIAEETANLLVVFLQKGDCVGRRRLLR